MTALNEIYLFNLKGKIKGVNYKFVSINDYKSDHKDFF